MDLEVDWRTAVVVAVLGGVAVLPLFSLDIDLSTLFSPGTLPVLPLAALFVLLPLPFAYIATISGERFRPESVATAATLPLATLGLRFAAVAATLVLAGVIVSWKARSIFHGDNPGWTYFKATGSAVTILAIALGLSAAFLYSSSPELRDDLRGNLTAMSVDLAIEEVGIPGNQQVLSGDQVGSAVDQTGTLARNISEGSIIATEAIVLQRASQEGLSTAEQQAIEQGFTAAEDRVPDQMETLAEEQIRGQLGAEEPDQGVETRDVVEGQVEDMLGRFLAPSPPVLAIVFFMVLSTVIILRLPFRLLGGIYGLLLRKLESVAG